jgi:putative addiction module component (TIGR02574 family)
MDKKALLDELQQLPSRERIELAYALLDSVGYDQSPPPVSDPQLRELNARLAHHREHPDAPAKTLEQIRRELLAR